MHNKFSAIIKKYYLLIISLWIFIAICCIPILPIVSQPFKLGGIGDPNIESAKASKLIAAKLPYGGAQEFILYQSKKYKVQSSVFRNEVKKSLDGLKNFPLKHKIYSPYDNSKQISDDNHSAFAIVQLDKTPEAAAEWMNQFHNNLGKTKKIEMLSGGEATFISDVKQLSHTDLFRAELIAFPLVVIALILVFGSLVAAFLPLISGAISITIIVAILFWIGHFRDLSVYVLNIATMLGLGLSLDYTLFMVNRFREELSQGKSHEEAIAICLATAGKAIFFSGLTVLISMSALLTFNAKILSSIGLGGVIVVIISVSLSLTFLPALLILLGKHVDALKIPLLSRKVSVDNTEKKLWFRMAMKIMHHPFLVMIPTIVFLIFLGYPFTHVKINRPNATVLPTWVESRQLYDKFAEIFDKNELSPMSIVFQSKSSSVLTGPNIKELYNFARTLQKDPAVERVDSIVTVDKKFKLMQYQQMYALHRDKLNSDLKKYLENTTNGNVTVFTVIEKYPTNDQKSFDLVKKIRDTKLKNITIMVAGDSANIIDNIQALYKHFYHLIIWISVITYLVLLILLRSIILPLKAIIMNFLSLFVCYGMLVFIFQDGHFSDLLNFTPLEFTDLNLPILLFCALFGLSMDYEVFLLTRIKEYYEKTKNNTASVALGLERSGRIITSAAFIVVVVCSAFITADIVFIKAFGLATALAVAADATVIRMLLVPSTMRILGDWNWYLPKWLDKILPKISLDPMNGKKH